MAQIPETIYRVSSTWTENTVENEYREIQNAIDRVPAWGKYVIQLCSNFMDVRELNLTEDNVQITIDGQGVFGIYFRTGTPICQISDGKSLKFTNMTYVRGDVITIRNDGHSLFKKCQNVMTSIDLVDGKYSDARIYDTKFYGADNRSAIGIHDSDCSLTIHDSFVKGGTSNTAISLNCGLNGNIEIKNSVILHYDGEGYYPIQKRVSDFVGIYAYNCVGNNMLCSNEITNYITANNNIVDRNINF